MGMFVCQASSCFYKDTTDRFIAVELKALRGNFGDDAPAYVITERTTLTGGLWDKDVVLSVMVKGYAVLFHLC